jgi:endonuclease YncB( thermonuclease family)
MEFEKLILSKVPFYSLNNLKTYARVADVYDGDTLTLVLKIYGEYYKYKCRLLGIDTAELRKSGDYSPSEKAYEARNYVIKYITNIHIDSSYNKKMIKDIFETKSYCVLINCGEFDKYGRLLCTVYKDAYEDISLNTLLINEKLAYEYFGGTKHADLIEE